MTEYQALLKSFYELQPCGLLTAREPVDMEHLEAKEWLQEMVRKKHLDRKPNGQYFVTAAGAKYLQVDDSPKTKPNPTGKPAVPKVIHPFPPVVHPEKSEKTKEAPTPKATQKDIKPRHESEIPTLDDMSTDELIDICRNAQEAREIIKKRILDAGIIS